MAWLTMKEAGAALGGVSVDTIKRRIKRGELNTEHENLRKGGYRVLVEIPDEIASQAAPPLALPAHGAPAQADNSHLVLLLQAHEREIERLQTIRQEELQQLRMSHRETVDAKDETIAELRRQADELRRQLEELRADSTRNGAPPVQVPQQPPARPWWRFWR